MLNENTWNSRCFKSENKIIEDLSFLFQIPEYCRVLEESEISEHCFDLIFAFDEIVALGYRENVNLAQIRTFTEMDSHEEKVFRAVREVRSHTYKGLLSWSGWFGNSIWAWATSETLKLNKTKTTLHSPNTSIYKIIFIFRMYSWMTIWL